MSEKPTLEETRIDFIERTGLISQAEGLPRIAGRIFGMLIFDGEMVSFGDLATRLQVSRASVSTSLRLLQERGLVKRMAKPGERQDYFQLAADPYATMLEGIRKRTQVTRKEIAQTINDLPPGANAVERVTAYANYYASLDSAVSMALAEISTTTPIKSGEQPAVPKDQTIDE
jgi:DNA-binding transcriptional regulator GbsR (MarR family)